VPRFCAAKVSLKSMKKLALALASVGLAATLSSCTFLYPHWGESPSPSPSDTNSASASPSASASSTPSPSPSASAHKGKANVTILQFDYDPIAQQIFAVGSVDNFSEDGGTCTLNFVGGGKTASISGKAESNASSTQCYALTLSASTLPKGNGQVSLTYDSTNYHGVSDSQSVTIQ